MSTDLIKTLTYLSIHLTVGFSVAYALTGSVEIAGGIALIEPCINAVAFFFHEKAWQRHLRRRNNGEEPQEAEAPASTALSGFNSPAAIA